MVLLAFMAATVIAIVRLRNLFAVVMLGGIYSLLAAAMFVLLDAVDVAFTEAAVGAGVATFLMLGTLALTTSREKVPTHTPLLPLAVAREVVRVAMFSATAAWCEVEWQESNYLRLMTAERGRDGWSDKQTAFIGLLHGTAMGTLERFYREESDCTADDGSAARETIDRYWLRRGEGGS